MTEPLVVFDGVVKRYGDVTAVKSLDLTIDKGEFVAIMGPSGCGKTTTLRMLAGLEAPSEGEIRIGGKRMNDAAAHERDTPLVWQSLALFPFLNVVENVEFGLKMRGVAKAERRRRAEDWLARMGLEGFSGRRIDQLSGGQRQRVALARSLVTEPEMLLLDEPLSALDAHLVIRMQGVLTKLQRELGITFVYVTHSQSEAFAMADRVAIMGQGELAQVGEPRDIYRQPADRFVAGFVGRNNIIDGVLTANGPAGGSLKTKMGEIAIPTARKTDIGAELSAVIAADRVTVASEEPAEGARVRCQFISEEFVGAAAVLYFETEDGLELKAQLGEAALEGLDFEPGASCWLNWEPGAAHLLEGA